MIHVRFRARKSGLIVLLYNKFVVGGSRSSGFNSTAMDRRKDRQYVAGGYCLLGALSHWYRFVVEKRYMCIWVCQAKLGQGVSYARTL